MNYEFIDKNEEFKNVLDYLKNQSYIAVDTESNNLFSYRQKLCLVQIESNSKIFIIDSLKIDVSGLKDIFENKNTEKIFHSAYSDISIIKRTVKTDFVNIFDIMLATKYVFSKAVSLMDLVSKYFNVKLDKKYQKINWEKRPLNPKAVEYAAYDVFYLKKLRDILFEELEKKGLYEEFKNKCEEINNVAVKKDSFRINKYIEMAHTYHLKDMEFEIFINLVFKREEIAREKNLPPFRIINNNLLKEISKNYNKFLEIDTIAIYNPFIVKNIEWIKDTIKNTLSGKLKYYSRKEKNTDSNYINCVSINIKLLKEWRKKISEERKLPVELIMDNKLLKKIAKISELNTKILEEIGVDKKTIELYGKSLIDFFEKNIKK